MKLIVNGRMLESEAHNLNVLLIELGYEEAIVATAINGDFVALDERKREPIREGDRIEILAPMKGG